MNKFLLIIGVLVFLIGLLWVGQGLGFIRWPAVSTMVNQVKWAYYGACFAFMGLVIIWLSHR